MSLLRRINGHGRLRGRYRHHHSDLELLEVRRVLDSVVVFNELMYHPAEGDVRGEWVELKNLLSVDVDLSGWSLQGGVDYAFPEGSVIPADGYALVVANPPAWPQGTSTLTVGPFEGALNNAGDNIQLRNNSDRVMDEIHYDDRGDWPVSADGGGSSLAKQDAYWTSRDPKNWSTSYKLRGTPGAANSPSVDLTPQATQVLATNSKWRYRSDGLDLGTAWRMPAFDDSDWPISDAIFSAGEAQAGPDEIRLIPLDATGDGEIRGDASYTHAIDFGSADAGAVVNGVQLPSVTAATIAKASNLQWNHSSGIRTQGTATATTPIDGPLAELFNDYLSNSLNLADGSAQLTLTGLMPGVALLDAVIWSSGRLGAAQRHADFCSWRPIAVHVIKSERSQHPTTGRAICGGVRIPSRE